MALTPTPELIAAARRCAARTWTVGPEGPFSPTDPHLRQLVDAGLARLYFTPAYRLADDYWALTDAGVAWLAEHDGARQVAGAHEQHCTGEDEA
jgi:hypothetical protein